MATPFRLGAAQFKYTPTFETLADAAAAGFSAADYANMPSPMRTKVVRFDSGSPTAEANYIEVPSEPAHDLKYTVGGKWFEIDEDVLTPAMAGAMGDGTTDDKAALDRLHGVGRDIDWGGKEDVYACASVWAPTLTRNTKWISHGATIKCTSVSAIQRAVQVTSAGFSLSIEGELTIDADRKAYTGAYFTNTGAYADLDLGGLRSLNAYRAGTSFTGGDGIAIVGAYQNIWGRPYVENVKLATGAGTFGSQGISGITITRTGSVGPRNVRLEGYTVIGVQSEDPTYLYDQDAVKIFQQADDILRNYRWECNFELRSGVVKECWGRAVKAQMAGIVDGLFVVRTTAPTGGVGYAPEIDFQEGGGQVSNIECLYVDSIPVAGVNFGDTGQAGKIMNGGSLLGLNVTLIDTGSGISNLLDVVTMALDTQTERTINIGHIEVRGAPVRRGVRLVLASGRTAHVNIDGFYANFSNSLVSTGGTVGDLYISARNAQNIGSAVPLYVTSGATVHVHPTSGCIGLTLNTSWLNDTAGMSMKIEGTDIVTVTSAGLWTYGSGASGGKHNFGTSTGGPVINAKNTGTGTSAIAGRFESAGTTGSSGFNVLETGRTGNNANGQGFSHSFYALDSGANKQEYGAITGRIVSNTAAAAEGAIRIHYTTGGSDKGGFVQVAATGIAFNAVTVVDGLGDIRLRSVGATAIATIGNAINTGNKAAGKLIWDSTNLRGMVAQGSAAGDAWKSLDGATTVTPA